MSRSAEIAQKPYAEWLESVVKSVFDCDPVSIAFQMRDEEGHTFVSWYNTTVDDIAIMVNSMQIEGTLQYLKDNKDELMDIINSDDEDEEDGDDGSQETDAGPNSEG